jgi:hypothetical protein
VPEGIQPKKCRKVGISQYLIMVMAFVAVGLIVGGIFSSAIPAATEAKGEASPTVAASPLPSPTTTPSQVPSPMPTTDPTQPSAPWTFTSAHLSIPSVGVDGEISEYTKDMLVDGAVKPPAMDTISWYSGIEGGTLSSTATNTTYLYGHSWIHPAAFNGVRKMVPGNTVIITTPTETLTYVMEEPVFTVSKPELKYDAEVTKAEKGRLVLVSCYRPDGYDPAAPTKENVVAVLQLVNAEPIATPERPIADRLP